MSFLKALLVLQASAFVSVNHFHPSLIFKDKPRVSLVEALWVKKKQFKIVVLIFYSFTKFTSINLVKFTKVIFVTVFTEIKIRILSQ
jgi:hypothetical protein